MLDWCHLGLRATKNVLQFLPSYNVKGTSRVGHLQGYSLGPQVQWLCSIENRFIFMLLNPVAWNYDNTEKLLRILNQLKSKWRKDSLGTSTSVLT